MPKVLLVNGYRFFFFSNEGTPMEPCHIHISKNGNLAKFWIYDKAAFADNVGFTAKELKEMEKIANQHINEIKEAWNEFFKR